MPAVTKRQMMIAEAVEAHRLVDDLRATGCGFVVVDDELRMTNLGVVSTALWLRFEAAGIDFVRLARIEADWAASSSDPATASEAFN